MIIEMDVSGLHKIVWKGGPELFFWPAWYTLLIFNSCEI